jgi:hypothetical protein
MKRVVDEWEYDRGADAFESFLGDTFKAVEKAAEEKGYQRGLKQAGAVGTASAKAEARDGQGPDTRARGAGGNPPYSQMTPEQRAALTPAQRDAAAARELGA